MSNAAPFWKIFGIVFGYIAKREILASNGALDGAGVATAGIVMGWIGVAINIVLLLFFLVFFLAAATF